MHRGRPKGRLNKKTLQRLVHLGDLNAELALQGSQLTIGMIQTELGLSKSQSWQYAQKLNVREPIQLNKELGEELARSFLENFPKLIDALNEDLGALNAQAARTTEAQLTLIRRRRTQVKAIADLSLQYVCKLSSLGFLPARKTPSVQPQIDLRELAGLVPREMIEKKLQEFRTSLRTEGSAEGRRFHIDGQERGLP